MKKYLFALFICAAVQLARVFVEERSAALALYSYGHQVIAIATVFFMQFFCVEGFAVRKGKQG
jgi:hypothetical protein